MSHLRIFFFLFLFIINLGCLQEKQFSLADQFEQLESIEGNAAYMDSPYVTAGDRLYIVGHQNGTFPDLGWHVTGEMGGIWAHPIKLIDGFNLSIQNEGYQACLNNADKFVNSPISSQFHYNEVIPGISVIQTQFVPDGIEGTIIEYTIQNESSKQLELECSFNLKSDLMPVWLGERTGMINHKDTIIFDEGRTIFKDIINPWYAAISMNIPYTEGKTGYCSLKSIGQGREASLKSTLRIDPRAKKILWIFISGSTISQKDVVEKNIEIQENIEDLFKSKRIRYDSITEIAKLSIPDKDLEQAFRWVKYNTDWLVRDVPGVGRGLSAGIPDYPWWFGVDNEYSLAGLIALGNKELVYETIDLLTKFSEKENGNGRIVHEISTNGAVFNPGNINETPQFASLIWNIYQWTGDKTFLEKYYPIAKKGMDWVEKETDFDGNLLPDGFGIMEIHGLDSEMIDVATYTQDAYHSLSQMAKEIGDSIEFKIFEEKADNLKEIINREFWVEEFNSFADFIGTPKQALYLIESAIQRADSLDKPWAVKELKDTEKKIKMLDPNKKRGFVLYHNWVVNTPMEKGIADRDKAIKALNTGQKFVNPFGVFVTGIDRDESAGEDIGSFASEKERFDYTGAVMTLPTGVQAIAEAEYGRIDQSLDYLKKITASFSYAFPGSIYEVSPDFGMITQAWTVYGYAVPIIQYYFGIKPEMNRNKIIIKPQLPSEWKFAKLENIHLGEVKISIYLNRIEEGLKIKLDKNKLDYQIEFQFSTTEYSKCITDKKEIVLHPDNEWVSVISNENKIKLKAIK